YSPPFAPRVLKASCELTFQRASATSPTPRRKRPSSMLKKVLEGSGCAMLIQNSSGRRTKVSQRRHLGFAYCASSTSLRVFQQTANRETAGLSDADREAACGAGAPKAELGTYGELRNWCSKYPRAGESPWCAREDF